jgi:hypothetical protein
MLLLLAALALALAPPPARAAGERGSTLLLSVAAPAGEAERLEQVTRELLARLDVQVELRPVARVDVAEVRRALGPGQRYFARVWIELAKSGNARLYLEHGASDRVLVRDVAGDADNPELVREELGHILQTAVEGLKAGEEVGAPRGDALKEVAPEAETATTRPDRPAPQPTRAAAPKPSERARPLAFGPRYEVSWLGDGARFEDGPGAVLELARPVGFELAGYYRRPLKVEGSPVGVRLQTLSARALVTVQVWQTDGGTVRLGAGAGADFVRVSPIAYFGRSAELADGAWRKLAVARLQASYARRAFRFLELQVSVGLDLDPSNTRYVFQQNAGERTVLEPSPLRPLLSVGGTVP